MFTKMSTQIITISPPEAAGYLKLNTYEAQRPIKPRHVMILGGKMKSGEFRIGDIAVAHQNGKRILMNGQHQLTACMKVQTPFEALLEIYSCANASDLSQLFRQFDNHQMRSLQQMVKAEIYSLNLPWKLKAANLLVTALVYTRGGRFISNPDNKRMNQDSKVRLIGQHIEEGNFFDEFFPFNKETRFLCRGGVAAAVLLTYHKDPEDAFAFWKRVRDGENLNRSMPEYRLRQWLLTNYAGGPTRNLRGASPFEQCYRSIVAWNAYRSGRSSNLAMRKGKPVPPVK